MKTSIKSTSALCSCLGARLAISHLCFNTRQQQLESEDAEFSESTPAADSSGSEIGLLPVTGSPAAAHTPGPVLGTGAAACTQHHLCDNIPEGRARME